MSSVFQKLLTTAVVEVHKEACKNYQNKTATCRLCVDCCSEEAISLQNQIPIINDKKCNDCGACVSECPVNAIDHISKPYAKIAQYIDNYPLAEITCDQVEKFNHGIKVPCLLYLDTPLLSLYADKQHELNIYTGQCHSCQKVAVGRIYSHLEKLHQHLEALGITIEINTKQQLSQTENKQTVNAITRREILKSFSISSIREFILPTNKKNDTNTEATENFESLSIKERMYFKKRLLNNFNKSDKDLDEIEQKTFKFTFSFNVNENCNGCIVCEMICPTKAIYWETNKNVAQLIFDNQLCVECDKCLACPVDALTKSVVPQVETDLKKELITMNLTHCSDCGEIFKAAQEEEVTCFFCKAKNEKDPTRFFTN